MRFYPADYDPKANPALPKTNSPVPFFAAMLILAGIAAALYFLFPPAVQVSQPVLDFSKGRVIATSEVSNHTSKPLTLTLCFDIGYSYSGTKVSPAYYLSLTQQEIITSLAAYSSRSVSCEFAMPQQYIPNSATAKIINRK